MSKTPKPITKKKYKDLSETFIKLWGDRKPVPQREHHFHPVRKWRFDIAWPDIKLAVELHGAIFARGRHTRGAGMMADSEKMNCAQMLGWNVLVYTSQDVKGNPDKMMGEVLAFLEAKSPLIEQR